MKANSGARSFHFISYTLLTVISLLCIIPFWLIAVGSMTKEEDILVNGFRFWPKHFSSAAYDAIWKYGSSILNAYEVTILITVIGTSLGLFLTAMGAYVLSRRDYAFRNGLSFFVYFTTLFSGGLIPWYIMIVKNLHLKDTVMALILIGLVNAWNVLLMRNFMNSIPVEVTESAKIDGAGDFTIFMRLILPLSTPALATIGLFIALNYWNDWFAPNLFITTDSKVPLQYFLYRILSKAEILSHGSIPTNGAEVPPSETLKMAVAVVATGPMVFLFPLLQRYFVKGLTIGAVKG
ncbi:carbohydrate ABC transporter permease [Paenibacillus sp. MMO-177]|uniref:carbohydrate ABC transporter permease n=1 Tax=Paenibacillus sp. MMO-177 TaxID=3081289 RepID=UPI00301891A8